MFWVLIRRVSFSVLLTGALAWPAFGQGMPSSSHSDLSGSFRGADRVSELVKEPSGGGFGLLDPSRFSMSQSYSMSYVSGSGYSGSVGLYMNTITYRISDPLTLQVGLGYLHEPLGFLNKSGGEAGRNTGRFLPNARLDYRPSEKFHLMVDFRTVPVLWDNGAGGYYGYRTPYWLGPSDPWGW